MVKHNIAPCGTNCNLCRAFQRKLHGCPGCRTDASPRPNPCQIRLCDLLNETGSLLCCNCKAFPCKRLRFEDARMRRRYSVSILDNLHRIRQEGIGSFLQKQDDLLRCTVCNRVPTMYSKHCPHCKTPRLIEEQP